MRGEQQNACDKCDNSRPAQCAQFFADKDRRDRGRHQGSRAARDRVDLTKIAGAIAFDQRGKIDQMDNDRRKQPGPRRRSRHAYQRCKRERYDTGAYGNQGRRRERIETNLYQRIPAGMACGGK